MSFRPRLGTLSHLQGGKAATETVAEVVLASTLESSIYGVVRAYYREVRGLRMRSHVTCDKSPSAPRLPERSEDWVFGRWNCNHAALGT